MAGEIFPRDLPVLRPDRAREEAVAIDDRGNLVAARGVDRLAAVQGFQRREGVGLGLDPVGDPEERRRAFAGRGARPAVERFPRRRNRLVDLRGGGFGNVEDQRAGPRVQDRFGRFLPLLEIGADQKRCVELGHVSLPHLPVPAVWSPSRVR